MANKTKLKKILSDLNNIDFESEDNSDISKEEFSLSVSKIIDEEYQNFNKELDLGEKKKQEEGLKKIIDALSEIGTKMFSEKVRSLLKNINYTLTEFDRNHDGKIKKLREEVNQELNNIDPLISSMFSDTDSKISDFEKKYSLFEESINTTFKKIDTRFDLLKDEYLTSDFKVPVPKNKEKEYKKRFDDVFEKLKKMEDDVVKFSKGIYEYGSNLQVGANGENKGYSAALNFKNGTNTTVTATQNQATGFIDIVINSTGGSGGTWYQDEIPSGAKNNSNKAFTLANTPTSIVFLFLNGQYLVSGVDYTISGKNITMTTAPLSTDTLTCNYL